MNAKRVAVLCAVLLAGFLSRASLSSRADDTSPFAAADAIILAEIHDHSEAAQNLEYISDNIGPRLTGSPQLKAANDWTAEQFRKYGLTNVHLESWKTAHTWTRGTAKARIVRFGSQFSTAEASLYDSEGTLVASGRGTYLTAEPKA